MLIGGLVLARWAYVSSSPLLGVLVTATTGMLASPITWTHHLIWVIPILAWLALAHDRPSRGPAWALLVAVVIWMSPMWLVSSIPVDELHENVIESIAANSYFLVLVGFLVGVACMLWRRQRGALQREARGPHAAPAKNAQ
jgi:alpha-1,2-mannosyltransferase